MDPTEAVVEQDSMEVVVLVDGLFHIPRARHAGRECSHIPSLDLHTLSTIRGYNDAPF